MDSKERFAANPSPKSLGSWSAGFSSQELLKISAGLSHASRFQPVSRVSVHSVSGLTVVHGTRSK